MTTTKQLGSHNGRFLRHRPKRRGRRLNYEDDFGSCLTLVDNARTAKREEKAKKAGEAEEAEPEEEVKEKKAKGVRAKLKAAAASGDK